MLPFLLASDPTATKQHFPELWIVTCFSWIFEIMLVIFKLIQEHQFFNAFPLYINKQLQKSNDKLESYRFLNICSMTSCTFKRLRIWLSRLLLDSWTLIFLYGYMPTLCAGLSAATWNIWVQLRQGVVIKLQLCLELNGAAMFHQCNVQCCDGKPSLWRWAKNTATFFCMMFK